VSVIEITIKILLVKMLQGLIAFFCAPLI